MPEKDENDASARIQVDDRYPDYKTFSEPSSAAAMRFIGIVTLILSCCYILTAGVVTLSSNGFDKFLISFAFFISGIVSGILLMGLASIVRNVALLAWSSLSEDERKTHFKKI